VVTTSGRTRGRQNARSGAPGPAAEHRSKIMAALATGVIVIVLVLAMTSEGHDIDAAVQRFMLFYAGVFALIALTASVGIGLIATDRIVMTPGHRVMAQAIHRAVSFGALAFLIVHIVTEILAQRVHVIDAVIPFLSPFRTFYIGLGTISSDLIVLLVVTSIVRKRFTAHGKAWRWRAIHYTAYVSFVFGVLHGLMGGRPCMAYVDWCFGVCVALVAFGLAVRFFMLSQRPKETLSAPPAGGKNGSSPLHAATLTMAQAQLGGTIQALPASTAPYSAAGSWTATALPASYGAQSQYAPALQLPAGSGYDGGYTPLGAPPYGDDLPAYPYQPALAAYQAPVADGRQPMYEPGYVGPPRYQGAPVNDTWSPAGAGPAPRALTGPPPRNGSGPMPRLDTGPMPAAPGPVPGPATGPMPRAATGPMPRLDPQPRGAAGQPPRGGTGPMPAMGTGPMPRAATGPMPAARGPVPGPPSGPMPRAGTGPMPRLDPGARAGQSEPPYGGNGQRGGTGPQRPPRPAPGGRRRRPPGEDGDPRRGGGTWR